MGIRVFIHGSCVTRDAFEFSSDGTFKIEHYSARSSLAGLTFNPIKDRFDLTQVRSDFQRRMLEDDHNRSVLQFLQTKNYDVIVLDFIDERGGLINLNNNGFVTNLAALHDSGVVRAANDINYIHAFGKEHKDLFLKGFDLFIKTANKNALIIINKVFWAQKTKCEKLASKNISITLKANEFLKKIYEEISFNYPEIKFIEYDDTLFIANPQHKWGLSPFHYIDEFYYETMNQIKDKVSDEIIVDKVNLLKKDGVLFLDSCVLSEKYDLEYAAYLFYNNERIETKWYQDLNEFKFDIIGSGKYKVGFFYRVKNTNIMKNLFSNEVTVS